MTIEGFLSRTDRHSNRPRRVTRNFDHVDISGQFVTLGDTLHVVLVQERLRPGRHRIVLAVGVGDVVELSRVGHDDRPVEVLQALHMVPVRVGQQQHIDVGGAEPAISQCLSEDHTPPKFKEPFYLSSATRGTLDGSSLPGASTKVGMETPYGEIPDRFVPDMTPVEMHDYLRRGSTTRRSVLKGAGAGGLAVALGPVLWRQSDAYASTPDAPQWIAYGEDPATQMHVSWSTGTAAGTRQIPPNPQVRWGHNTHYGAHQAATNSGPVPVPSTVPGEPAENTIYNNALLTGLHPDTTYHYSVSNDGKIWSADVTFRTAVAKTSDFRFTAFGDHGTHSTSTAPMAALVAKLRPAFCVVSGDLSYATPLPIPIPQTARFHPEAWDKFLGIIGPAAAQSIPWQVGVGTHEIEPLENHGYDGFLTRFPQPYDRRSGSPVVHTFTYGNVAFIQLDGNDLSAQATQINGYSQGAQTRWLEDQARHLPPAGLGHRLHRRDLRELYVLHEPEPRLRRRRPSSLGAALRSVSGRPGYQRACARL